MVKYQQILVATESTVYRLSGKYQPYAYLCPWNIKSNNEDGPIRKVEILKLIQAAIVGP